MRCGGRAADGENPAAATVCEPCGWYSGRTGAVPLSDFSLPAFPRMRSGHGRIGAYAGLAAAYLVVYLALNFLTDRRSLGGTSITLWSPDDALSVLLIMESWTFAPVLWLAQIAVDLVFHHVGQSFLADVLAQTTLAAGFCGLAYTLRAKFGFNVRALRPRDLIALTAVVPIGVALVGLAFCGALLLVGELAPPDFLSSFAGFWIGDAAAMCVLIPAAGALFRVILVEILAERAPRQCAFRGGHHRGVRGAGGAAQRLERG